MKVLQQYPGSHHYWENYEKSDYKCPACGEATVWESQGEDDYLGSDYVCTTCGALHYITQGSEAVYHENVLSQLRTGNTHVPTTKRGR